MDEGLYTSSKAASGYKGVTAVTSRNGSVKWQVPDNVCTPVLLFVLDDYCVTSYIKSTKPWLVMCSLFVCRRNAADLLDSLTTSWLQLRVTRTLLMAFILQRFYATWGGSWFCLRFLSCRIHNHTSPTECQATMWRLSCSLIETARTRKSCLRGIFTNILLTARGGRGVIHIKQGSVRV